MLRLNSIWAGVAAVAIVFSATLNNEALAVFAVGNMITHTQSDWGDTPTAINAAGLLLANYDGVYASTFGVAEVGIHGAAGFSIRFTNPTALIDYLPGSGLGAPLTNDEVDPLTTVSGGLGGEAVALRLNIDFSTAGLTLGNLGIPFGDLELHSLSALPLLNGLSVRQFIGELNTLLGGSSGNYSIAQLGPIAEELNRSFAPAVTTFAQDHLRVPVFSNGDFITHTQANWGDEIPTATNPAGVLLANYNTVYAATGGVFSVGRFGPIHYSMQFDNAGALLSYLPAFGLDGRLQADHLNPLTTNAGGFGGEVAALKLNIDFADAFVTQGNRGIPFGDLQLHGLTEVNQTQFNGFSVRQFFASASFSLGTAVAADVSHFNAIAEELNAAFDGGNVTAWARNHLRTAAGIPGDYNANGIVDAADYVLWRVRLNRSIPLPGDTTPWSVTAADYNVWRAHFGQPPGSGSSGESSRAAVPEPAAAGLALVGLVGLMSRRIVRRTGSYLRRLL